MGGGKVTMAEKEERILIKKQINYHPPYGGWCGDGKEIVLTRSKAIEKISKALDYETGKGTDILIRPDSYAETALDALLGEGE